MNQQSRTNILFVLIAFLFVVVLILLYLNFTKSPEIIQIQPVPVAAPTNVIDQVLNWKTYSNSEIEFKYFKDLVISQESSDSISLHTPKNNYIYFNSENDSSSTIAQYLLKVDKISATAWEGQPSIQVQNTKKTIINGLNCIQRIEYLLAADVAVTKTYFKKGNLIVVITFSPAPGNKSSEDEKNYSQILSTFKFTEKKVVTSSISQSKVKTIIYLLPQGWLSVRDNSQLFEVGYNPMTQDIQMSTTNIIIKDKLKIGENFSNEASYMIVNYDGGSRHTLLSSYFGGKITDQDKFADYSEIEYLINGKNCLFLNGISYSQFPLVWGLCPVSTTKGLLITTDDRANFVKSLSTLKFNI